MRPLFTAAKVQGRQRNFSGRCKTKYTWRFTGTSGGINRGAGRSEKRTHRTYPEGNRAASHANRAIVLIGASPVVLRALLERRLLSSHVKIEPTYYRIDAFACKRYNIKGFITRPVCFGDGRVFSTVSHMSFLWTCLQRLDGLFMENRYCPVLP